jgi:hypothetical protein
VKLPTLWVETTSLQRPESCYNVRSKPKSDLQQHRQNKSTPNAEQAESDWHAEAGTEMDDNVRFLTSSAGQSSNATHSIGRELILKETCFKANQEAQFAFKILMIHWVLQFTLRIAFRCVLHRCENQDIHR